MENLTKIFTFRIVIFISLFASSAFAQNQVRITLHQLPPNQLSAKDLWKMTLDNTTESPLEVYLEGYGEEQNEGRIVDGRSLTFTLPPGRSNYNYENFKTGNVNWKNRDYEEFIVRTGTVPAGTYATCVTAYSTEGVILGMEKCITQVISRGFEGEITLITPSEGENIDPSAPITFSWTPLPTGGPYKIKIVEIIGNESPENAMLKNKAFFEKDDIRMNSFQYPSSAPKFEEGKKYAWLVSIGDVESGISVINPNKDDIIRRAPGKAWDVLVNRWKCHGPDYAYQISAYSNAEEEPRSFKFTIGKTVSDVMELEPSSNMLVGIPFYNFVPVYPTPTLPNPILWKILGSGDFNFCNNVEKVYYPVYVLAKDLGPWQNWYDNIGTPSTVEIWPDGVETMNISRAINIMNNHSNITPKLYCYPCSNPYTGPISGPGGVVWTEWWKDLDKFRSWANWNNGWSTGYEDPIAPDTLGDTPPKPNINSIISLLSFSDPIYNPNPLDSAQIFKVNRIKQFSLEYLTESSKPTILLPSEIYMTDGSINFPNINLNEGEYKFEVLFDDNKRMEMILKINFNHTLESETLLSAYDGSEVASIRYDGKKPVIKINETNLKVLFTRYVEKSTDYNYEEYKKGFISYLNGERDKLPGLRWPWREYNCTIHYPCPSRSEWIGF